MTGGAEGSRAPGVALLLAGATLAGIVALAGITQAGARPAAAGVSIGVPRQAADAAAGPSVVIDIANGSGVAFAGTLVVGTGDDASSRRVVLGSGDSTRIRVESGARCGTAVPVRLDGDGAPDAPVSAIVPCAPGSTP